MNQKKAEYIALYFLVLVDTLVGVLARQFVLSRGVDDSSSTVAFFATVIVLMVIYTSLQTTFNQFLLPRVEAFLLRFSAFQTMKNYTDTVSVPEAPTIKDSNQATLDVIESAPTTEETISEPSEYEVMRTNAIAEKNRAIQTKFEKVISYTKQTMVAYMSEEDLNRLCAYIVKYSSGDTLQKISPLKVDSQLKSIESMQKYFSLFEILSFQFNNIKIVDILINMEKDKHHATIADILYYIKEDMTYLEDKKIRISFQIDTMFI